MEYIRKAYLRGRKHSGTGFGILAGTSYNGNSNAVAYFGRIIGRKRWIIGVIRGGIF